MENVQPGGGRGAGLAGGGRTGAQAVEMLAQQQRHAGQQLVFARADRQLHHRIHLGQPRQFRRALREPVAQASAQPPGRGLHRALHRQAVLAIGSEVDGVRVGDRGRRRGQIPGDRLGQGRARARHLVIAVRARRRRGGRGRRRTTVQGAGQGDRTGPVDPLAQPLAQRRTRGGDIGVRDPGQQADEGRARNRAPLQGCWHFSGRKTAILHESPASPDLDGRPRKRPGPGGRTPVSRARP